MEWLLAALAVKLALALLLAVPVRLRAALADGDRPRWRVELAGLGGLVRVGRDGGGYYWVAGRRRRGFAPPGHKAAHPEVRSGGASRGKWGQLVISERRAVGQLLSSVWAAVAINARGDFDYGCRDPALTAVLHALYCAVRGGGGLAGFTARPDFTAAGWCGQAEVVAVVRPVRVIAPVGRFLVRIITAWFINKRTGGRRLWQTQI